jgi:DNA repair protein RadC
VQIKMTKTIKNDHSEHRKRLRERFLQNNFDGFHSYEVLEFLLTFIFRQGDVKPVAKDLINCFGSFSAVLDAEPSEIAKIKGMGENSAVALSAMRNALKYYFSDSVKQNKLQMTKMSDLIEFVRSQISNRKNEVFMGIFLNAKNEVLHFAEISEGTLSQVSAYPRKIVESALKLQATSIILAHNHPDGVAAPSDTDVNMTNEIRQALHIVDIYLQEHIIIANQEYYSFRREGIL